MTMSAEGPIIGGESRSSLVGRPDKRVPDFFIVGHAKCGTTALYRMLRNHPQIHMPAKEPRFFAYAEIDMNSTEANESAHESPDSATHKALGKRPRTLDDYVALFADAGPGQRVGEATPAYLRSSLAASRIASVRPDARIIAILREPASFLRSFHLQSVRGYNETEKNFRKAIELVEPRREGRYVPRLSRMPDDLLYTDHVRYVEQLRRYHDVFAAEQVLVIIYEDFRDDNEATVRQVLRFLEVDEIAPIRQVHTRPSRDVRFAQLHKLVNLRRVMLRNVAAADAISRTVDTLTPTRMRGAVRKNWRRVGYGDPPAPDEEFLRELRHRFKPQVEALSEYLGRDLVTLWGYHDVA